MAHAVSGPGSAPEAHHDWFADFAEEEPEVPASRPDDSSDPAFDSFTPEHRLAEAHPLSSTTAAATVVRPALRCLGEGGPHHGRAMRFVALAAGLVALAAWWIVPRLAADVTVPNLPAQRATATAPALPSPPPLDVASAPAAAAPAPSPEPSKPPAPSTLAPPTAAPAARGIATPATPEAQAARAAETPAIDGVLGRYRAAFGALDATRVTEVWPAADRAALERTFAGLTFQSLEFERCAIDVRDRDAQASCRGRARIVTKATAKTFLEPRRWDFILRKDDRGWVIRSVAVGSN